MTANADTGATKVDTIGNGTTGHVGDHSATSDGVSRAGIGDDDRSWSPPTNTDVRHDRIRWGAVWTGVLTTLSTYIVLQLLFFALGWLDLGVNGADGSTRAIVSGVLALIAFFLGGAAAGASALWHRANDGMVNGVVTWAATVIALLGIALVGGGALAGSACRHRHPVRRPARRRRRRRRFRGHPHRAADRRRDRPGTRTVDGRRRTGRLDRREAVARPRSPRRPQPLTEHQRGPVPRCHPGTGPLA